MKKKTKNIIFYITIFFFFAFYVGARQLETDYPGAGFSTTNTPINVYVRYLFGFISGIAGLFALLSLTIGGFQYLTSLGNPTETQNAIKKIISSFFGLIIILGGWIILWRINYSLINLSDVNTGPITPVLMYYKKNISSPIIFCQNEITDINLVIDETVDDNTKNQIVDDIKNNCIFVKNLENNEVPSDWRDPEAIYIFPDIENIPEEKYYYGVALYSVVNGKIDKGQIAYNLTYQVKKIIPMSPLIYFANPFYIRSSGGNSSVFPRSVKLYKYINRESNLRNQTEEDPNDCDLSFDKPCFGPFMTTETEVIKGFNLKSGTTQNPFEIRSVTMLPESMSSIVFFLHYDCRGIPSWEDGEHCKIYAVETSINNLQELSGMIPINKISAIVVIAGMFGEI